MNPFTDDDLKRLKEALSGELPRFSYWAKADLQVLVNLIARTEAGERTMMDLLILCDSEENRDAIMEAMLPWRKSAGKS